MTRTGTPPKSDSQEPSGRRCMTGSFGELPLPDRTRIRNSASAAAICAAARNPATKLRSASLGHLGRGRGRSRQAVQPGRQPGPDLRVSQLGGQAPAQQQVDHDPGGQVTDPALDPARFLQRLIDHLERHLLRQLAQVTRRETPCCHRNGTGNDRLIHGGSW
jgi:hypothetical protein